MCDVLLTLKMHHCLTSTIYGNVNKMWRAERISILTAIIKFFSIFSLQTARAISFNFSFSFYSCGKQARRQIPNKLQIKSQDCETSVNSSKSSSTSSYLDSYRSLSWMVSDDHDRMPESEQDWRNNLVQICATLSLKMFKLERRTRTSYQVLKIAILVRKNTI